MKDVVAQADRRFGFTTSQTILPAAGSRYPETPACRAWAQRAHLRPFVFTPTKAALRTNCARRTNIWLRPEPERLGEKIMMGTLALTAFAGVAYGFNMLINFVENWAVYQSAVAQALQ